MRTCRRKAQGSHQAGGAARSYGLHAPKYAQAFNATIATCLPVRHKNGAPASRLISTGYREGQQLGEVRNPKSAIAVESGLDDS